MVGEKGHYKNIFHKTISGGAVKVRTMCMVGGDLNSSQPSADCSRHSNLAPTILITKYKGFLCDLLLLWEWQRRSVFELWGMMS